MGCAPAARRARRRRSCEGKIQARRAGRSNSIFAADRRGQFAKYSGRGRRRLWLLGLDAETVAQGIEQLKSVPGRLEKVANDLGITILVDYAHTPDALEKVLGAVRPMTRGKLITVFGCGGDRDRGKRPLMGEIAGAAERCRGAHFG